MADESASTGRTELAEDRTILANERTFAGWLRTGLAAVGIGLAFHVLFGKIEPAWLPRAIATAFLLIAILVVFLAERRATAVLGRLDAHVIVTARTDEPSPHQLGRDRGHLRPDRRDLGGQLSVVGGCGAARAA